MIETSVIELLRKTVVRQARESGGTFFVEYGRPFKATAVVAWLIALAAIWIISLPSTRIQPEAIPVILGIFLLLAAFLHSEFFGIRITYSVAGVKVFSRWGGHQAYTWGELKSVDFLTPSQNYVVRVVGDRKFTFNYLMSGYESLRAEIQRRTATTAIAVRE